MAKAREFKVDCGGMFARRDREFRPREMRRATDGNRQIAHQRQVGHLLDGDLRDEPLPFRDDLGLIRRQPVTLTQLEAPGSVEVAAHDIVFDGCGFGEHEYKLFSIIDADLWF